MAEFIIVFREVLEASLVVGIIYLLIEKTNQNEHFSQLWYGVFASILASIFNDVGSVCIPSGLL